MTEHYQNYTIKNAQQLASYCAAFPEQAAIVLAPGHELRQLIGNITDLFSIIEIVVKVSLGLAIALLKPQDQGGFRHLIDDGYSLACIITAVPAFAAELLSEFSHLITEAKHLAVIVYMAPEFAEVLLKRYRHLINNSEQLAMVLDAAPACAPDLLRPQAQGGLRYLIASGHVLADIVETVPAFAEDLLQPQELGGFCHVIDDDQLDSIIRVIPAYARYLLQSLDEIRLRHYIEHYYIDHLMECHISYSTSILQAAAAFFAPLFFSGKRDLLMRALTSAKETIPILTANIQLFPEFDGLSYLFYTPEDQLQYYQFALQYKLCQLVDSKDPLQALFELEVYFYEKTERVTSFFNFKTLSKFIDQYQQSPVANLCIAMILESPAEFFCDPDHPAHDGTVSEIEYRANRLIDAARYAFKAMSSDNSQVSHLALAFLFNIKCNLEYCMEGEGAVDEFDIARINDKGYLKDYLKFESALSQYVVERLQDLLRKLEKITFDFTRYDRRTTPLPSIDLVIRQPAPTFFLCQL